MGNVVSRVGWDVVKIGCLMPPHPPRIGVVENPIDAVSHGQVGVVAVHWHLFLSDQLDLLRLVFEKIKC
jgi:hypothetical protein